MQKELRYDHDAGQGYIQLSYELGIDIMPYYDFLCELLGCEISELALLAVHEDFLQTDSDGWKLESFFPRGADFDVNFQKLSDAFIVDSFAFGEITKVVYKGEIFIAEKMDGPYAVWCSYKCSEK